MKRDYQFKVTGDAAEIRAALNQLEGTIQSLATRGAEVEVAWRAEAGSDPLEKIKQLLEEGKRAEGVLLLELFLSDDADDERVLYNLGMAYSDAGNFRQAVTLLRRLTQKDSTHTHGRIALGVALLRSKKIEEGIEELQTAVRDAPDNVWAQRNLGAGLLQAKRYTEALPHLRRAQELAPDDQAARFGYGQALELNGNATEADEVYRQTIDLDEFSEIAELARKARSKIAEKTFHNATPDTPRMDAVMYCVGALEKFERLSPEQVKSIGVEIALLGARGLDVNSAEQKYTLRSLAGKFSGLHLVCLEYVAFKKFAPEQNIGFDLTGEYKTALGLFKKEGK